MPDGYDETRPENHVFLAHARFIAPRRGSRVLSDTSVCPSGYASSYFLEVRRGEWEVRTVQNIADILVDPEGSLERRNHLENTSHAQLSVRSCMCSMPERTRPWRRRGIPVRSETPDRIDQGGQDDDAASGGGRSAPDHCQRGPPAL